MFCGAGVGKGSRSSSQARRGPPAKRTKPFQQEVTCAKSKGPSRRRRGATSPATAKVTMDEAFDKSGPRRSRPRRGSKTRVKRSQRWSGMATSSTGVRPRRIAAAKTWPPPQGDCPVCCDAYTAVKREPIHCPGCNYAACVVCVKTYLLGSLSDPACMKCGLYWCRAFLDASLTPSWRNGPLRKHRERVLLDREYSLIPQTQPEVAREAERRQREATRKQLYAEYKAAQLRVRVARRAWSLALAAEHNGDHAVDGGHAVDAKERRAFVAACPSADCRGFLSMQYKCGTCLRKFCARCREPKLDEAEHACDPGTVETIALIARATRACPNCGMAIERVSGCDHMWCTGCDTGFSYATGQRIANHRNTNPHMYERMQQLQAAAGADVQQEEPPATAGGCGGATWPRPFFTTCGEREGFMLSMHYTGRHVELVLRDWPRVAADLKRDDRQLTGG